MHVRLKVVHGANSGKEIPVPAPKCVIGRGEDCQLRTQVDAVSRQHCEIVTLENEVIIRDLKSRNGTFVNGERVNGEAVLLAGDVLRVGPVEFEALIEQTPGKAKRSKVSDIKEAVARTAGGNSVPATTELGDVGDWLDEADTQEKQRRGIAPETRQFRMDETTLSTGDSDASNANVETKPLPPEPKKTDKKKQPPGKLPPRPSTQSENSRAAAADMLKKFFNRR
jgi:pSer/pThr/pTyr-binding forkhead associated (FHA) protein